MFEMERCYQYTELHKNTTKNICGMSINRVVKGLKVRSDAGWNEHAMLLCSMMSLTHGLNCDHLEKNLENQQVKGHMNQKNIHTLMTNRKLQTRERERETQAAHLLQKGFLGP